MLKNSVVIERNAYYDDLSGRRWSLASLTRRERAFLRAFIRRACSGASWPELSTSWRGRLLKLYHGRSRKKIVQLPLYAICQDLESRVGIEQGFFRQRDYRDDLAELVRRRFPSRYRFASEAGIDESLLSRVLRKGAHLSIQKLDSAVASLGYRVALIRSGRRMSRGARIRSEFASSRSTARAGLS